MTGISSRLRALVVMPLVAVLAVCSTASTAHAAGDVTRPDIYGCFIWGGGVAYAGQPVTLKAWKPITKKWGTTRAATTNSGGCVRFNDITPGHYYMIEAYKDFPLNCYYYDASSPWVLSQPGDSLYRVGTTYVVGPYVYC